MKYSSSGMNVVCNCTFILSLAVCFILSLTKWMSTLNYTCLRSRISIEFVRLGRERKPWTKLHKNLFSITSVKLVLLCREGCRHKAISMSRNNIFEVRITIQTTVEDSRGSLTEDRTRDLRLSCSLGGNDELLGRRFIHFWGNFHNCFQVCYWRPPPTAPRVISGDVYTGQRSLWMVYDVSDHARASYHVMHGAGYRLIVGLDEVVHQSKLLHCQQKLWFTRCYGLSFETYRTV